MAKVTIKFVGSEEYEIFDLPAGQTKVTKSWLDEQLAQVDGSRANIEELSMDGVTSIGQRAFMGCTSLKEVIIPEGVTVIWDSAFYGCTGLASVIIPEGVTSIGDWAFAKCTGLASVIIPEGVTVIGRWAFRGCTSLASVTIPASVTSIGQRAFMGCTSLASVTIPASVTSIGRWAFASCTSLERIVVHTEVQKEKLLGSNLGSNSGIAEDKIICLEEILVEGNIGDYGITYNGFMKLSSAERDFYLTVLKDYQNEENRDDEPVNATEVGELVDGINDGIESKSGSREEDSAIKIQKVARGWLARRRGQARDDVINLVCKLQLPAVSEPKDGSFMKYLQDRFNADIRRHYDRGYIRFSTLQMAAFKVVWQAGSFEKSEVDGGGKSEADNQGPQGGGGGEETAGSPVTAPAGKGPCNIL